MRVNEYDEKGDTPAIVKELVSFLRMIVLFDNVYAVDNSKQADNMGDAEEDEPAAADSAPTGVQLAEETSENPEPAQRNQRYQVVLASLYRFAQFFNGQSLTYSCSLNV